MLSWKAKKKTTIDNFLGKPLGIMDLWYIIHIQCHFWDTQIDLSNHRQEYYARIDSPEQVQACTPINSISMAIWIDDAKYLSQLMRFVIHLNQNSTKHQFYEF